jgi:hypothetical protein
VYNDAYHTKQVYVEKIGRFAFFHNMRHHLNLSIGPKTACGRDGLQAIFSVILGIELI